MRAEYRVLGPLEVLLDGEPVAVPAGRCQVLLAALLLRPNKFVSADELVEIVWDGAPPRLDRARATLQVVVRRLRNALGDASCVTTVTHGYQATVDPDQLDLLRFRALVGSSDFGAASALWRGPVLGNVISETLHRDHVPMLVDERLVVLERRIDADLDRGLAGELVTELRSLVADHPLRESFWRHLMLALYRTGQQAEALATYRKIRDRLADELGVDPGPELQELHEQILRADVASVVRRQVPRQLPAGVRNFVGRADELAALGTADGITVLHGVGGVGKTALALEWARAVRDDFPDGDLYVNLRGFDPEAQPVSPAAAAETLLVGLGVKEVPADEEARFAALRTELADRRLLLVLDNVASARQVLPLLPNAPRVRVLITSRNQLRALVSQHDATAIGLGQLGFTAAHMLLGAVLGECRLDAEPAAARAIVERCAGLPLALRVFAERVARFPDTLLQQFVSELDDARLDAFTDYDDIDVRTVFSWSYRALDDESARMFRLLSLHPGPDFDVSAAAALAGISVAQARRLLERLVADHLVQSRSPGRYDLHDLLRAYASELCGCDEAAALRMTEWYVHTLEKATLRKGAVELVLADAITSGVTPQEFVSQFDALAWCRQEWDNLREVMYVAIARGWGRLALLIPAHLNAYLLVQPFRDTECIEMCEAVLSFGTELDQGVLRLRLARMYDAAGRPHDSLRTYETALRIAREVGEKTAEVSGLINMANPYHVLGRYEEALDCSRRGATLARELGDRYRAGNAFVNLAIDLCSLDRFDEALPVAEQALVDFMELGDEHLVGKGHYAKASALVGLGRLREAADELEVAIASAHRFGDLWAEAWMLCLRGATLLGLERYAEAADAWQRAADLRQDLSAVKAEKITERLAELQGGQLAE